ncbi:coiled-coil and C2 domain-containing protein 2A-like isoform X2 [Clavelina lepadiformis]|uniref:coiled-coil and C2 domain-containing protein 2A-like isoform X2 n=1 Tax=Clavelina lepadiformis TaxID=159417 RepID=UPI00404263F3
MDAETLREKLRARRRAMNVTMKSDAPDTSVSENTTTGIEELTVGSSMADEYKEEDEETFRSVLASRREMSRRKLEEREKEEATNETLLDALEDQNAVDELLSSPRPQAPASNEITSPRDDTMSTDGTPRARVGQHSALRNRLQAKLQAAKRAGSPSGETSKPPRSRRLKDRMDLSNRFTETVKQHTVMEEEVLLKRIESKLKWKHAITEARASTGQPSDVDCYDFFTKQYEDVAVEEEPAREEQMEGVDEERTEEEETLPPEEQPPTEEDAEDEVEDDQKKLISDVIPNELDWRLFHITAASYPGYHAQLERESLTYFVPSILPTDITKKVDSNTQPRYLEDEGFYVGEKPLVLSKNKNILENRFLRQPDLGKSWFGADGEVESLPNPVKKSSTKPWVESIEDVDGSLVTIYTKACEEDAQSKYLKGSEENELQIDIGTVVFHHHPLMSREHVLASNINRLYDEYLQKRQKNYVNFYTDKLAALRSAVSSLKDSSMLISNSAGVEAHETRINDFTAEIRRTSQQLNTAESSERDLMRGIIAEWGEIKSLRELQDFTNTTTKLTVKREEVNQHQDQQRWDQEVESEVREKKEEYDVTIVAPYKERHRKYQAQLQEWKRNRLKIKQQRRRDQRGSKENLLDAVEGDEDDEGEIMISGNVDKPQKPEKPEAFNEERVRIEVKNLLLEHRRNPGEDRISLQLTNTANITPVGGVPVGESSRRKAMQKSAIILKIVFNGKDVFLTEPKTLTSDFKLHFGSIFRVRIAQWPESLKVQFLEAGLVRNTTFSETFLKVPDVTVHSGNVQLGMVPFVSERVETFEHEGVGSSTPFTLRQHDTNPTSISTKGQLICSVSWGLDGEGHVLAPKGLTNNAADPLNVINPSQNVDPVSAIGAEGIQNPESLSKWVQDSRLDPNDPENAALIPFMESRQDGHGFLYAPDYFRLEQLQEEFNFIADEEFARMNRLRILQLRNEEVNEFRNMTMIPSQEHEVMDSAFTVYERRLREKDSLQVIADRKLDRGMMSEHRLEVLRFRQRVKDAVLHRFYASRHHYTFLDMVHEDQVPDIGTLGASVGKLVEPRRPLKPIRKERKKATAQTLSEGSVKILVNLVRGINIPTRQTPSDVTTDSGTTNPTLPGHNQASKSFLVAPFVAISFQDNVVTSSVAQGPSPSWNEELQVPFFAPNNDYSPSSLQTVDDIIYLHLFDRIVEESQSEEDSSITTRKMQNHWLGSSRIPFSTVYQRGKVEGTFKMKVPPVLLGYELEKQMTPIDPRDRLDIPLNESGKGTYLTLFITLEPTLKPMDPVREKFASQEDELTLHMSATYLSLCNRKYPQRNVKTTVIDMKGESVLVTRYVHPLQPPLELTEGSDPGSLATAEKVARFVSLIPFVSDNVAYVGVCDLWGTCDQFLHMLCGDEEEHAVLLLNYFLHLGKRAYLLLGNAVPEGNSAYVLTVEETTREYFVWNANTGQHYLATDNLSPLKSIGCLVNGDNIWFNIQPHDQPSKVRFELTRGADWKPFFTSKFPRPPTMQSVQPDSLFYVTTDRSYVSRLTDSIERTLKEKIMAWRPRHVTRWNRTCNSLLLQILRNLEQNLNKRNQGEVNHGEQLLRQLGDVKFTGFPMDLPFTDMDGVVSAVRSTEVHKMQDPDVEFSLAVYVHPYPSSVLAVWIYVAAIVNRRRHNL